MERIKLKKMKVNYLQIKNKGGIIDKILISRKNLSSIRFLIFKGEV